MVASSNSFRKQTSVIFPCGTPGSVANPRLFQMIEALRASQGHSRRGNMLDKERRAQSLQERHLLVEALEKRDESKAEAAAKDHLRKAREHRMISLLNRVTGR